MGPAQFGTHCVSNWEGVVEPPHIAQVGDVEPLPEPVGQPFGKLFELSLSIGRAPFTALFVFQYQPPYVPVGLHHGRVDTALDLVAGLLDELTDFFKQVVGLGQVVHGSVPSSGCTSLYRCGYESGDLLQA